MEEKGSEREREGDGEVGNEREREEKQKRKGGEKGKEEERIRRKLFYGNSELYNLKQASRVKKQMKQYCMYKANKQYK